MNGGNGMIGKKVATNIFKLTKQLNMPQTGRNRSIVLSADCKMTEYVTLSTSNITTASKHRETVNGKSAKQLTQL